MGRGRLALFRIACPWLIGRTQKWLSVRLALARPSLAILKVYIGRLHGRISTSLRKLLLSSGAAAAPGARTRRRSYHDRSARVSCTLLAEYVFRVFHKSSLQIVFVYIQSTRGTPTTHVLHVSRVRRAPRAFCVHTARVTPPPHAQLSSARVPPLSPPAPAQSPTASVASNLQVLLVRAVLVRVGVPLLDRLLMGAFWLLVGGL
jgi:hypothetical protein